MSHGHLIRDLVYHPRGAVEVPRSLLGVTLSLVLTLGLRDLHLPLLRLLQHGLACSGSHHLEGDDGWQLLPGHGDVHGGQPDAATLAVVLGHAGVGSRNLMRNQAEHGAVSVFVHAHPGLLLSQHVADRGQHLSGGGAAQQGRGVCRGGDGSGNVACVGVRRLQGVDGRHGDGALWKASCCLHAIGASCCRASSISCSHPSTYSCPISSCRLLPSLSLHVFHFFGPSTNTSYFCAPAPPALLSLWSRAHANVACSICSTHNR